MCRSLQRREFGLYAFAGTFLVSKSFLRPQKHRTFVRGEVSLRNIIGLTLRLITIYIVKVDDNQSNIDGQE